MNSVAQQGAYSAQLTHSLANIGGHLIDGNWIAPAPGSEIPVYDPSTGTQITSIYEASDKDVDLAVAAARRAFDDGRWSRLAPAQREAIIRKFADLIEQHADELSEMEAVDVGKPLDFAQSVDIPVAVEVIRYYAGWVTRLGGDQINPILQPLGQHHAYTLREPVGVAALIVPWNFPLAMMTLKVAPALAAGCTMVLKPAEVTSLSSLRVGQLALEAGIPAGVLNIVTGRGPTVGEALVRHPDVDKVSFTGSTAVGKIVMRTAADTMKRVTMELGGKSPVIVMDDVDVGAAAQGVANGILFNSGQICVAGSRLYAHRKIYDQILEGVSDAMGALKVGPSLGSGSQLGPLVSEAQQKRVLGYIDSAVKEGASIVRGGDAPTDNGYYVAPTLIADVTADMKVMREEIFGPVLCVNRFDEIDEVIKEANSGIYGLAAYVWTRDVSLMHKMASRLRAGTVWGNSQIVIDPATPSGGFKQSGFGRELGLEGLMAYTESKTINIAL
ncbi:aldehyde dehydrogenase [Sphingobium sp. TA15]|uniref:NAD-dependent aldehyde dehydrogenase n=1 Tax=Sphingobium indicum (strain DSM 16413 / CCM 7287 / MTCC 6362 / UT26 / NBRC 101211 / UT26S) TaxID=452662 RepID=D4Z0U3_SPHIU|nr:aldehyde dehydrogenase family protein [Sphingobium indicum]BAI96225.1 NAD-dependent aldehyde dehydrogenase [Sphingobium indicum UT26S]BDD65524.1 aldehyde dehydrogenase [Sphingobium sp. TA15]